MDIRAAVGNNNVVLSSFSGSPSVQATPVDVEASLSDTASCNNRATSHHRSADVSTDLHTVVVAPSAVVSGGMLTAHHQSTLNGSTMSPWQRSSVVTGGGGRGTFTRPGCSYGVSSPCCKLLPAAVATSSASSSCQLRSVTLPRGHPAAYSGEVATRLRPPPPPSAAAIRQAAQRASLAAGPAAAKMLEPARSRSHAGRAAGLKTDNSNVEQRRSVSTVIV